MKDLRAAMGAALAPAALAPPIARSLNLSTDSTAAALALLAAGAQPVFVDRYRREQIGDLRLRDLERIQARAAAAAAFELRRHQLIAELSGQGGISPAQQAAALAATEAIDLDDLRTAGKRRKKGAAAQARRQGLSPLASLLWQVAAARPVDGAEGGPPISPKGRGADDWGAGAEPDAASDPSAGIEPALPIPPAPEPPAAPAIEVDPMAEPAVIATAFAEAGGDLTGPQALSGARAICGDDLASDPQVRRRLRTLLLQEGTLVVSEGLGKKKPGKRDAKAGAKPTATIDADAAASGGPADEVPVQRRSRAKPAGDATVATAVGADAASRATEPGADGVGGAADLAEGTKALASRAAEVESASESEPVCEPVSEAAPVTPEATAQLEAAAQLEATPETAVIADAEGAPGKRKRRRGKGTAADDAGAPGKANKEKPNRYAKFVGRTEPCAKVGPGVLLALQRGEREGALKIDVAIDDARVGAVLREALQLRDGNPTALWIEAVGLEAWHGALGKAIKNAARKLLKAKIDRVAVGEYCEALRPLLLSPALGPKPVLGIDPGFAPGCRIAVVDAGGRLVASDHVYPLTPKQQLPQTKARIAALCTQYEVAAIVVTNAGGGREVERLCREAVHEAEGLGGVMVTSVDADAAAQYASSHTAKDELPGTDIAVRRATSAARRVQEPLAELIKLDARKLGLGQYQYEVDQEELRAAVQQVITSCINAVSVELGTVTVDRLARVAGLSQALAKAIVAHREQAGPFRTRAQLLEVEGLAGTAFEQAAGFVRIEGGENPLDRTQIHPERYAAVTEMAADLGVTVGDLLGNAELVDKLEADRYVGKAALGGIPMGKPTFEALVQQLKHPGADPRPPFEVADYAPGLHAFSDLEVGMELPGVVTHVAGFGAFIDVGLSHEGLVHVSELTHGFVDNPAEAVHVGQKVRGKVIDIDAQRKRFGMSLRALLPKPDRPAGAEDRRGRGGDRRGKGGKPGAKGSNRRDDRGPGRGRVPAGKGGGGRGEPKEDRVLGFNMDLSAIAERLKNG